MLITAGLVTVQALAAEVEQPLHVLYLEKAADDKPSGRGGGGGGGGGGSRTNYVYLPGQTLAVEAIYFDHRSDFTNITGNYLKHYDAVVQAVPDA
ncbi:MAG: hypothetical protein JWM04_764, partial [Verrucomicrobiales bacterium]|nr:hypothetical protein [Verrucomicrobiales bacterium]